VLESGRIAQSGDHGSLLAQGGLYRRLYEAQNSSVG
jgi:ATP-binding cassette subfamily B protein